MLFNSSLGGKDIALSVGVPYYSRVQPEHQAVLGRCVDKLRAMMPVIGLRNPKIGRDDNTWTYCGPFDWVIGFHSGQLWLAYQLTGDPAFANSARARRTEFQRILDNKATQDHDLGFQFSLSSVAEWRMTGDAVARQMGLDAAKALANRFQPAGKYIQAWNAYSPGNVERSQFAAGRAIADSMINLSLLNWAYRESSREDFRDIAAAHANTLMHTIIRPDFTSYHCYLFDPVTGKPLRGQTHQGFADDSCWSRGQSWLIHGFAQCYRYTGNTVWLDVSKKLASKTEELMHGRELMPWDFSPDAPPHVDSSAAAVTASGVYMLANLSEGDEAVRWRAFGDRLLDGLLKHCDLTTDASAQGMLSQGASHIPNGFYCNMLPYGDYYFMEALMRSLGHDAFFW